MRRWGHKKSVLFLGMLVLASALGMMGKMQASETSPKAVEVTGIDYDKMEITIKMNGNAIVYYSTDKSKWYEADGAVEIANSTDGSTNTMDSVMKYDISWVSASANTKLYFRGNATTTTETITIPKYNSSFKVTFDKLSGEFDFQNTEGVDVIRWRKSTDYNWRYVYANRKITDSGTTADGKTIQTLANFEKDVENMRIKGTKLIFQTISQEWTSKASAGARPSKEVQVTVPAKRTAPSMKVNVKKMTVNTSTKYEWSKDRKVWKECSSSNMELSELAPETLKESGATAANLYFRLAPTTKNCESKVSVLSIPPRAAAPKNPLVINYTTSSGGKSVKANVIFSNVPSEGYEYVIVKSGKELNEKTAAWKTITKEKTVKYTQKGLPEGAVIYVRVKGISQNDRKHIDLQLPSQCFSMVVPAYPGSSKTK